MRGMLTLLATATAQKGTSLPLLLRILVLTCVGVVGGVHEMLGGPDLVLGDVTELAPPVLVHLVLGLGQLARAAHQVRGPVPHHHGGVPQVLHRARGVIKLGDPDIRLSRVVIRGAVRDTGYLFSSLLDQLIFYYTFHSILVLPILAVQFGSCEGTGKQTGSNVAANISC